MTSDHNQLQGECKLSTELNLELAKRAHDENFELIKFANEESVKGAASVLRMSLILNGGAAISLLTYISSASKSERLYIAHSLLWFAGGALTATTGLGIIYISVMFFGRAEASQKRTWEYPYVKDGDKTKCYRFWKAFTEISGIVVSAISLALFSYGVWVVSQAISQIKID